MEKKDIVKKICDLYKKYGIKSITMDDAARHLGISKKTLYQHFSDKTSLVKEAVNSEVENRHEYLHIFTASNRNAIEDLLMYYKVQIKILLDYRPNFIYDLKKYYPDIYNSYVEIKRERILSSVKQNLIKGKKEGLYRNNINVDIIGRLLLMRIEGMIHSGIFLPEEIFSTEIFTEIVNYHIYGIVSDKGREYYEKNKNLLTVK
jgi:AcrR family transcriptional regulator